MSISDEISTFLLVEVDQSASSLLAVKMQKNVRFCGQVYVRQIEHMNEYSAEEFKQMWYSRSELLGIRKAISAECDALKNKSRKQRRLSLSFIDSSADSDLCSRGLEGFLSEKVAQSRIIVRARAKQAVLSEQQRQWKYLGYDPESLSRISISRSEECVSDSIRRANEDAVEARSIMDDTMRTSDWAALSWNAGSKNGSLPKQSSWGHTRFARRLSLNSWAVTTMVEIILS